MCQVECFLLALQLQHLLISTKHIASVAKTQAAIWLVLCTTELNLTGNIPRELSILCDSHLLPTRKSKSHLWLFDTSEPGG